jgi:phosphoribosylamine--glycine ligase
MTVIMAAKGYPGTPAKGGPHPRPAARPSKYREPIVFQAGTAISDGKLVASGGRVLAVTSRAQGLGEARNRVYQAD